MAYFGNNKQLNAAIAAKHTEEMKVNILLKLVVLL